MPTLTALTMHQQHTCYTTRLRNHFTVHARVLPCSHTSSNEPHAQAYTHALMTHSMHSTVLTMQVHQQLVGIKLLKAFGVPMVAGTLPSASFVMAYIMQYVTYTPPPDMQV